MQFLYNQPAVVWKDYLVISDIHLGHPLVPPPEVVFEDISSLMVESGTSKLIILGDVKDSVVGWKSAGSFLRKLAKSFEVHVCKGNHDGNIEVFSDVIHVHSPNGDILDGLGCFHGHALPSDFVLDESEFLVLGHVHPVYRENSFTSKAFFIGTINSGLRFAVLPSFYLTGSGKDLSSVPMFRKVSYNFEIYLLNGLKVSRDTR